MIFLQTFRVVLGAYPEEPEYPLTIKTLPAADGTGSSNLKYSSGLTGRRGVIPHIAHDGFFESSGVTRGFDEETGLTTDLPVFRPSSHCPMINAETPGRCFGTVITVEVMSNNLLLKFWCKLFLAIKQKTPNRWVSNFRGSLHGGGLIKQITRSRRVICSVACDASRASGIQRGEILLLAASLYV